MKIAVVGATGNVGREVCRRLMVEGFLPRILTRSRTRSQDLVDAGAEIFIGSFDDDSPEVEDFFEGIDVAFTMVRSDWTDIRHYETTGRSVAAALSKHKPKRLVNLSSVGADLEDAGHSTDFFGLERMINEVMGGDVVHVRAGWFMENFLGNIPGIARLGVMTTMIRPDLPLPCVATQDVARAVTEELVGKSIAIHGLREVQGPSDLTMAAACHHICTALNKDIKLAFVPSNDETVREAFLARSPSVALWNYRMQSNEAFNSGRARFYRPREDFDYESIRFEEFIHSRWLSNYGDRDRFEADRQDFSSWLDEYAAENLVSDR